MVKCSKSQVRQLKTAVRWKIPAVQRQRIPMVLLRESGMTQPAITAVMVCVPRTSSGVLKVRPGNIGDEGHQEQGEM